MQEQIDLPFDLDLPPAITLTAGSLTCMYETGNIRYLHIGSTELVRKIYGAVRYETWETIPFKIQGEKITVNEADFFISYTAVYEKEGNKIYKADFEIEGKADNTISFSMKGIALDTFKRNRIGLCLHHPVKDCIGRTATVTSVDGSIYQSPFPGLVNPDLPFLDIKQLEWVTADDASVQLTFEGDVFETEDQRNWSDSSFKTYSTRSDLPKPVTLHAGDTIDQRIVVKISGVSETTGVKAPVEIREDRVPFPQIGYCHTTANLFAREGMAELIAKIPFDHYRFSIHLAHNDWKKELQNALTIATQINTRLLLVIFFPADLKDEVEQLSNELGERQLLVDSILLLREGHNVSSPEHFKSLYPVLKSLLPAVKIGYGTEDSFVDVNQHRPLNMIFNFISFGVQPQAHAFDNRSVLENLQSQQEIMTTAIGIAGGQPVFISPITLKDRSAGSDERQYSWLTALYTLISIQNLSEAYSITLYDLFGDAGILRIDKNLAIQSSPLYEILAAIYNFQPAFIIKRYDNENLIMDGLLLENEKGNRLFFKSPKEYQHIESIE